MNEESEKTNNQDNENSNREIKDEFSLSWLVVFCLLSPYLTINPGKRYEATSERISFGGRVVGEI